MDDSELALEKRYHTDAEYHAQVYEQAAIICVNRFGPCSICVELAMRVVARRSSSTESEK